MNSLVASIVSRCQDLVAGQTFDDPAGGAALAIEVHAHALPIPTTPAEKTEQSPYLVVRLVGLEGSQSKINPVVRLIGEIYTADGVAEGMADLLSLINCLRPLADRGPGNIAGYKIIPPINWQIGDKENGDQPHPFYQFQADLRISGV